MSFTITGELAETGEHVTVTWVEPGQRVGRKPLRGHPGAIERVRALDGQLVDLTPTGPGLVVDLDDPVGALAAIRDVMRWIDSATGDVPVLPIPDVPDGAVA